MADSDLTDLKHREEELERSLEELRRLASHLQSVREQERADIAREIHDEMGQELTALKIALTRWRVNPKGKPDNDIESMIESVDRMLQTVQRIATELRPSVLDHLGLYAAVEWHIEQFQKRTGIPCELALSQEEAQAGRRENTALFRILQEALTNIARHAEASRVRIRLEPRDGSLVLEIEDNGKGIRESEIDDTGALGILGMRERALDLGGEVVVARGQEGGTRVWVRIPHR